MAPLLFSSLRKNLMNRKINTFLCLYNRITRKKAHLSPYSFSFVLSFLIVNFAARSKVLFLSYIRGEKLEPHLSCHWPIQQNDNMSAVSSLVIMKGDARWLHNIGGRWFVCLSEREESLPALALCLRRIWSLDHPTPLSKVLITHPSSILFSAQTNKRWSIYHYIFWLQMSDLCNSFIVHPLYSAILNIIT